MKKRLLVVAFVVVLIFTGVISASAGQVNLVPFEIWSEDEVYVFRFEPNEGGVDYAQAAVYRGEELIYTVEGLRLATRNSFFFSRDMRRFAFMPPLEHEIALQFYANGTLVRTYHIRELVRNINRIRLSSAGPLWIREIRTSGGGRRWDMDFLPEHNQLVITTADRITHTFDITTAEVTSETPFFTFPTILLIVTGAGIVLAVILFLTYMRRKGVT